MEATYFSEKLIAMKQTTRCHFQEVCKS